MNDAPAMQSPGTWLPRLGLVAAVAFAVSVALVAGPSWQTPASGGGERVVGLGDSVMAGTHCDCAGIVAEYAATLRDDRAAPGVAATNLAVPGATSTDLVGQLRDDLLIRHAVAASGQVLIATGANDFYAAAAQFENGGCDAACYRPVVEQVAGNLETALRTIGRLRASARQQVFVLDYWNIFLDGAVARQEETPAFLAWSRAVSAALNARLVQVARTEGAIPVAVSAAFSATGADVTQLLAADGDHPNATGVHVIVRAIASAAAATP